MEDIKLELSKKLKPKPEGSELGFGRIEVDHMFVMDYIAGKGWHSPRIVPFENLSLSPFATCLHYGQMVFEGLKAYRSKNGDINLFRPRENFKRLNKSCDRLCIPNIDVEFAMKALSMLLKIEEEWIPSAENTSLYIRPLIIATDPYLGLRSSDTYQFIIMLCPSGSYYANGIAPVRIYVENEYVRAVKGGMGMAKTAGNYAISLKSQVVSKSKGYDQVLWLDAVERKYIEEVGAMNIFFVIDDVIVTPATNGTILEGITRMSVLELLRRRGYELEERRISIQEVWELYILGQLKEVFGTGTAAVVSPVKELSWNDKKMIVGEGKIGKVCSYLYEQITGIQSGLLEDEFNWVFKVK